MPEIRNNMNKYQIKEVKEIYNHAGSKAVEDVCAFAAESGYEPLYIRQRVKDTGKVALIRNQIGFFTDWLRALGRVKKGSLLLVQNPFKRKHLGRFCLLRFFKKIKKLTIISLIHDVEELRLSCYRDFSSTEFEFMKSNSDYFIVHNKVMKQYFVDRGFEEDRLTDLGIFDYGMPDEKNVTEVPETEKADVVIAGNLDPAKCPYIYKLFHIKNKFTLNLYGPDYDEKNKSEYITYRGSFPAEKVPYILNGRFGLIWDGDNINECTGETGNYLQYNNPHKTSLYLVSGIPVIIWEKAALSSFVKENNLGITINSLEEIREKVYSLSEEDYHKMLENARHMAKKLKDGYHTKKALADCEKKISAR